MFKDFYRPNKQKVILAIIIMIVHIGIAFYSANTILCTHNCPTPNTIQKFAYPTVYPFYILMLAGEFFEDIHFLPEALEIILTIFVSLFVLSLIWYSLSCGIVKSIQKYYANKRLIYIILSILSISIVFVIYYNFNIEGKQFLDFKKGSGVFVSNDGKLSFIYPKEIQYKTTDKKTEFYIVQDSHGDIGQIAAFGFEFVEDREGDINELYKNNIFYKEDSKNYYGKQEITISNHSASQYSFCDSTNCSEENMVHEIFIEYDNKIYSFMFGGFGTNLEQEVSNSIKFN